MHTCRKPAAEDHKTLTARVDKAAAQVKRKAQDPQTTRLARLKAELAFQDSQRRAGVYRPDTPPIVPPRAGSGRYGLGPARPKPAHP